MRDVVSITKALADPSRLRVLSALRDGELCVCQIIELLRLAPSTVSKHLAILAGARLVDCRKEGRWCYYRLAGEDSPPIVLGCLAWLLPALEAQRAIASDRTALQSILKLTPEQLCDLQAKGIECCSSAPETPAAAKWPKGGCGC